VAARRARRFGRRGALREAERHEVRVRAQNEWKEYGGEVVRTGGAATRAGVALYVYVKTTLVERWRGNKRSAIRANQAGTACAVKVAECRA